MKILELEIEVVRGIKSLKLTPNGKNLVIWGPNGSGKSAVVDAIDFLLTGKISRLTGKGTGSIGLKDHGPHIDYEPKNATVRALVKLPELDKPVELRRCMSRPSTLIYDEKLKPYIQSILNLALRGQHVLTRREILKYITAESSTRAQEIQDLLDLNEIEDIRKSFVNAKTQLDRSRRGAESEVKTAKAAVNATVGEEVFNKSSILKKINKHRKTLEATTISDLKPSLPTKGLKGIPTVSKHPVNLALVKKDVENLLDFSSKEKYTKIKKVISDLGDILKRVKSDPKLLRALSRLNLYKQGIALIDETGNCPLCDKSWPPGELRKHLEQCIATANIAKDEQKQIKSLSEEISEPLETCAATIRNLIKSSKTAKLEENLPIVDIWLSNLEGLSNTLNSPLDELIDDLLAIEDVQYVLSPSGIKNKLKNLLSEFEEKYPEASPEQIAWDSLTRIDENLKALERANENLKSAMISYKRSDLLLNAFEKARDVILKELYESIKDRFVGLYKQLHGPDEKEFSANIAPDGAGLKFEVDFYGRGNHPPHALHSEGHQDSMGVCLYLALAEKLTEGKIDLVVLDDVVMSVDSDHRRDVCHILANSFPGRQFLITTHDKTWAHQLRQRGVVDSNGIVEFFNWHIETGPLTALEKDVWERLQEDLQKNNISNAAHRLRRYAEEFYSMVCDSLQAKVRYRLDGKNELGDFLPSAMSGFRKYLKQAKKASQSWGNEKEFNELNALDSIIRQVYTRSNAEQWAVNANVHYSKWYTFSQNDFRPVVEAFQDLCALFICNKCHSMLRLLTEGPIPKSIQCNCSTVNWNLIEKAKI